MTANQQTLAERIQALTLEVDEVKKAYAADAVELSRIKKLFMYMDNQALTHSLSGSGEAANHRFANPGMMHDGTGNGKMYGDPIINTHNR